jgi:hypothetical protein
MASNDYAGVDPGRMAKAASALENLRDVLAANVPTIVNTMNSYGSPISLSLLPQAQAHSVIDAADMRARSNLAQKLYQTASLDACVTMVQIPWDGSAVDAANAQADAQLLQSAEKDPNSEQAVADIQAVADDVSDHLKEGDTGYLSDFYNQAGPQVAGLAGVLHSLNGSSNDPSPTAMFDNAFSKQDQQILNTFATGLAYVDSKGMLQPTTIKQLTATSTLWSMGMLVKYGPSGAAWSTADPGMGSQNFLATLTMAEYNAEQNGTLRIPLGPTKYPLSDMSSQLVEQGLAQYDPLSALLQADAQNKTAAYQLLGSNSKADSGLASYLLNGGGVRYSQPLGSTDGYFTALGPNERAPGNFPEIYEYSLNQQAIGSFLDAATSAPRGGGVPSEQSAWAAYNIINNVPAPLIDGGSVVWQVTPPVQAALMATFSRYMPDLAASADDPVTSEPVKMYDGVYCVGVSNSQLSAFIQEISLNQNDFTQMQAMSSLGMGTSLGIETQGGSIPGLSSPVEAFAQLYSDIGKSGSAVGITEAQQQDLHNQMLNQMISMAETGFGLIPGDGEALTGAKAILSLAGPVLPQFSTDNASNAISAETSQQQLEQYMAIIPLVRGLSATGALKPPLPPGAFTANGTPTSVFADWWKEPGVSDGDYGQKGNQAGMQTLEQWRLIVAEAMNLNLGAPTDNLGGD